MRTRDDRRVPAAPDLFAGLPEDVAGGLLGALSGLVLWADQVGLDVVPEVLLARDVIDRYAAVGMEGYSDSAPAQALPPGDHDDGPYTRPEIDALGTCVLAAAQARRPGPAARPQTALSTPPSAPERRRPPLTRGGLRASRTRSELCRYESLVERGTLGVRGGS